MDEMRKKLMGDPPVFPGQWLSIVSGDTRNKPSNLDLSQRTEHQSKAVKAVAINDGASQRRAWQQLSIHTQLAAQRTVLASEHALEADQKISAEEEITNSYLVPRNPTRLLVIDGIAANQSARTQRRGRSCSCRRARARVQCCRKRSTGPRATPGGHSEQIKHLIDSSVEHINEGHHQVQQTRATVKKKLLTKSVRSIST